MYVKVCFFKVNFDFYSAKLGVLPGFGLLSIYMLLVS